MCCRCFYWRALGWIVLESRLRPVPPTPSLGGEWLLWANFDLDITKRITDCYTARNVDSLPGQLFKNLSQ